MMDKMTKEKTSNVYYGFDEIKTERAESWWRNRSEAYKEYRKKWEEYPKQLKIPEFPMHIDIESTSNCNLMCPMCARTLRVEKGIWRENANIDFELFKRIVDEGVREGLCAINLNNFGEALMNPNLPKMVEYAKSNGILDVFFHTNGLLLRRELSRKLIEAGLDRIVISFDKPCKGEYEKIRVGAKYETVLQNIKDLFNVRKEMNSSSPLIRINMIKFPGLTTKEVEDMKKLFLDITDSIGFLEFEEVDSEKKEEVVFPPGYKSKFICPMLISRLTVLENGDVVPCCIDLDATLKLGNLKEKSLKEMWNCNKLEELRKLHFQGRFYEIPTCKNCDWAVKAEKNAK